jgi:hypothetical protein
MVASPSLMVGLKGKRRRKSKGRESLVGIEILLQSQVEVPPHGYFTDVL